MLITKKISHIYHIYHIKCFLLTSNANMTNVIIYKLMVTFLSFIPTFLYKVQVECDDRKMVTDYK